MNRRLERKISRQVKISKTAVQNAIKNFQNKGTFKNSERSGRPRISSSRNEGVIRKVMSQSPMSSAKKYRPEWQKEVSKLVKTQLGVDYLRIMA